MLQRGSSQVRYAMGRSANVEGLLTKAIFLNGNAISLVPKVRHSKVAYFPQLCHSQKYTLSLGPTSSDAEIIGLSAEPSDHEIHM